MGHMSRSAACPSERSRVGVLDNDCCALECIVSLLHRLHTRTGGQYDVWSTDNPAQAIHECRFAVRPTNVMLVDLALNGLTGAQVAQEIRRQSPAVGIIGITSYRPETYTESLRAAGAQALLDKSTLKQTLADATDTVSRGLPYPDDTVFSPVDQVPSMPDEQDDRSAGIDLTPAERRVLALSLTALSTKQIAATLHVSADTVFSHRRNIKNKMHTNTWYEVMDFCRTMHIA